MITTSQLYALGWLLAAILFGVAEGITVQLVSIWFAVGSLAALVSALLGAAFGIQLVVFGLTSAAVLAITRPVVVKKLAVKKVKTNADRIVGMVGTVVQEVDNLHSRGRVHIAGLDWAARSEDGVPIPEGEQVLIKSIEGVKVIVEQL